MLLNYKSLKLSPPLYQNIGLSLTKDLEGLKWKIMTCLPEV